MIMLIAKIFSFLPCWLLYPTLFLGKKNIPKGAAILVSNHLSNTDPAILAISTLRSSKVLGKKELFKNKFFGFVLKSIGIIPVDRSKTDLTAIKLSLKYLKRGKLLTIFPEGTRNRTESDLSALKSGSCMLAIKAKCPIVPVWIQKKPRLFHLNRIRFGKAFTLEQFYDKKLDKENLDKATEILGHKILENKF